MWHRHGEMTFSQMRESIMTDGAAAFENATGINIVFDYHDILSIADPHVLARGFSPEMGIFIQIMFTYRHWWEGWRVDGFGLWDDWVSQPQMWRARREGRRHVDTSTVDVHFYAIVDWGGSEYSIPVHVGIPGETFADEFIRLFNQYVNTWNAITMLDMWFIGDNRLYVNLCNTVMNAQGSATGFAVLVSLYRTLFSIPGVEEIVVLVEGQPEAMGDHIGFAPINRRSDHEIQSYLSLPRR